MACVCLYWWVGAWVDSEPCFPKSIVKKEEDER
jgi:hypothetical protein